MARTTANEASFASSLLTYLSQETGDQFPQTAENVDEIEKWITREGGGGANNPLNTTQVYAQSTPLAGNSAGVQNYATLQDGVVATAKTLLNGYYPNVIAALKAGNALTADKQGALSKDLSTWSGGGYTSVAGVTAKPVSNVGGDADGSATNGQGGQAANGMTLAEFAAENGLSSVANDPEIKPLLTAWDQGTLTDQEFATKLQGTSWWQSTPQSQRTYLTDNATDPATLKQTIANAANGLVTQAAQMGVPITDQQATALATQIQTHAYTQDEVQQQLANLYKGGNTGQAGQDQLAIKQLYADYVLPVSPQTLQQQVQKVLSGKATVDDLKASVIQQAQLMWGQQNPLLSNAIKDGSTTTSDYLSTYKDIYANTTGDDPSNVNWLDPKFNVVLTGQKVPAATPNGPDTYTTLSPFDWQKLIQTDPIYGFDKSANGIAQGQNAATAIKAAFSGGQ